MEILTLKNQYNNSPAIAPVIDLYANLRTGNNPENNYYEMKNAGRNPGISKQKGRMVKGSLFPNPVKELSRDLKTFKKTLKGQGTDYSIGKLNDLAIASGTGLIALTLSGVQKVPHARAMEFIGAGAWLASMHLWPKIFLAKPIKAATGVDLNLEYINAQGDKKPYWQDPQYIPMDLLDKQTLDKAADKLNVPKDMKDRDEETFRRMKKVATGTNTWWMLTAGFSTPIMASIIANKMERPAHYIIDNYNIIKAQAQLEAAGISTGPKNLLVKIGKKLIKLSNHFRPDKDQKALEKVLVTGNQEAIETFFSNKFKNTSLFHPVLNEIEDAFNEEKLPKIPERLTKAFDDANKLIEVDKAFNNYSAALSRRAGRLREYAATKTLTKLFTRKEIKEIPNSEKIAQRAIDIAEKEGKTENIIKMLEKIAKKPIEYATQVYDRLAELSGKMAERIETNPFGNSVTKKANELIQTAGYKLTGTEATFGRIPQLLRQAKDPAKHGVGDVINGFIQMDHAITHDSPILKKLAMMARSLVPHDVWNSLAKNPTDDTFYLNIDNAKEFLEGLFGKGKRAIGALLKFLPQNRKSKESMSKQVSDMIGETPADFLQKIAKEYNNSTNKWFTRVGVIGGGALLATSAAALYMIINNAKKPGKEGVKRT